MAFKMKGHSLQGPNQRTNTDPLKMTDGSPLNKKISKLSKFGHGLLDVAGLIPGGGVVADAANAAWYKKQGKLGLAAVSAAAMVPGAGQAVMAAKYGGKVTKLLKGLKGIKGAKSTAKALPPPKSNTIKKFSEGDNLFAGPKPTGTGTIGKTGIVSKAINWAKKNPISTIIGVGGLGSMLIGGKNKDTKDKKVTTPTKPKVTLDTKVKGGSQTWRQGMKSSGGSLNDLVSKRKGLKKGSDEYNSVQNKINVHLGSSKRHGVTSSTGTKGRKTTTTKNVPGVSDSTSITKKRNIGGTKIVANKSNLMNNTSSTTKTKGKGLGDGKKIKTTTFGPSGGKTTKVKEKYNRNKVTGAGETGDHYTGRRKKRKVTTYNDDGTITKMKINDRTGKVKIKTRKKGGTGLFNRNKKSRT